MGLNPQQQDYVRNYYAQNNAAPSANDPALQSYTQFQAQNPMVWQKAILTIIEI